MVYRFLDTLLDTKQPSRRSRRRLTLPVSIGIHVVVLAAVLIVPMLTYGDLPEPANDAIRAFLVEAAPPPPPPPPPPAAAAPRPLTAPKVQQPKPVVDDTPKFTAPVETPKSLPEPEPASAPAPAAEPGGMPGGVEGGVKGGTEGGVVGGVLGGEPGGVVGGVIGGIPKAEPPATPTGPVRVGGKIHPPAKVNNVAPVYPSIARQARVEGMVILEATIDARGSVTDVKVLRGIPLLDAAAIDAVKQWRYSPTLLNGEPVPVVMTVTVNFRLSGDASGTAKAAAPAPAATPAEPAPVAAASPGPSN